MTRRTESKTSRLEILLSCIQHGATTWAMVNSTVTTVKKFWTRWPILNNFQTDIFAELTWVNTISNLPYSVYAQSTSSLITLDREHTNMQRCKSTKCTEWMVQSVHSQSRIANHVCPEECRTITLLYRLQKTDRRDSWELVLNLARWRVPGLAKPNAHILDTTRELWILATRGWAPEQE